MSSTGFTFQYKPRSEEAWEARRNQQGGTFIGITRDEFKNYSPRKGQNWVRILPPTWPDDQGRLYSDPQYSQRHYGYEIFQHSFIGPQKATLLCLNMMKSKPCPICEYWQELQRQDREDAFQFKPVKRILVWWVDRKDEDAGPQLWAIPWKNDREISLICKDPENGALYHIDNPFEGYDLIFTKEGELTNTNYTGWQLSRRASSIDLKHVEYAVKHPVPTTLLFKGYPEMKAILVGGAAEVDKQVAVAAPVQSVVDQTVSAPAPITVTAPLPQPAPGQSYCYHQATFKGERLACGLPTGHTGEHDYVIGLSNEPTPAPIVQQICEKTFTTRGFKYACGFAANHSGECDFSRELGPVQPAVPTAPAPGTMAAARTTAPTPVTTEAVPSRPLSSRAEALRSRFPQ